MNTDLSKYDNSWYNPGGNSIKRFCWYFYESALSKKPLESDF